jgi:aquaporin NIP
VNRYIAESLGTFALVFIGTGVIVVDGVTGGAITHLGVCLAFGLVVMAMIHAVGDVSGAHINPAVTFAFFLARRIGLSDALSYGVSQCAGALLASALLAFLFADPPTLGATLPTLGAAPTFLLEVVISFLLMFVILGVATGPSQNSAMAGVVIGGTVCMCALFAGPLTGASMSQARSLGPAVVAGQLGGLWIYLVAPLVGTAAAVGGCRAIRGPDCCSSAGR